MNQLDRGAGIVDPDITLRLNKPELQVEIDDGITKKRCDLKNSSPAPAGLWPMIGITLEQTNGNVTHAAKEAARHDRRG